MRRVMLGDGGIYHIYNRGVEKREVFLDDQDRLRFLQDLREMNTSEQVSNFGYALRHNLPLHVDSDKPQAPRGEKLVDIMAFVLMPNHFHLLLIQRRPCGVQAFMHKLGTAYTMYFNRRYQRTGMLFQGPFKSALIKRENHFEWIPHYIHANPLKLQPPLPSVERELEVIKAYKWSSFRAYAGLGGFPGLVCKTVLEEFFARDGGACDSMLKWLKNRRDLAIEAKPR